MDVYKIGVSLSMTSNAPQILQTIASQLLHVHTGVNKLQGGFKALHLAIGGALMAKGAQEILKGVMHVEEAGEKLAHAKVVFEAGLPKEMRIAEMTKISAAAWKEVGDNLNTSVTGNVEVIHDLYNTVQDVNHAIALMPAFNVMKNAMDSVTDGKSVGEAASNKNIGAAARAFELMGKTDHHALEDMAKDYTRMSIALRGRVTGGNFLQQVQSAGDARYGWNKEFATAGFGALINAAGMRSGMMINAAHNNLYGGVSSSQQQMANQVKWGLFTDADRTDPSKKKPGFHNASMLKADLWRENPLEWANEFRKHLAGKGVDINSMRAVGDVVSEIGRGNKGLKMMLDELLLPTTNRQLNKEMKNIGNVGADAAGVLNDKDPKSARSSLKKQWENVMEGFGEPLVQPAIKVMKSLSSALSGLSQWAAANGDTVVQVMKGIAVAGVALAGGGGVALLAALGPAGWIAAGIIGLGAAVVAFKPQLENVVQGIGEWMKTLPGKIAEIGALMSAAIGQLPGMVSGAISAAIGAIGGMLSSAISGIAGKAKSYLPSFMGGGSSTPAAPTAPTPPAVQKQSSAGDVYLDGRKVGKHVARAWVHDQANVRSAAGFDGRRSLASVDMGMA